MNSPHTWALPRRLRLERAFELEREPDDVWRDHDAKFIRPMQTGALGLALNLQIQNAVVTTPDDLDAIERAICNDREWLAFDRRHENAPHGRPRFRRAEVSDKGRYLLGVLQLFESLPDAFNVLMDGFWHDVLHNLGASPIDKRTDLPELLIKTLRRRLNRPVRTLAFDTQEREQRLAREALRIARSYRREQRYCRYDQLKQQWSTIVDNYLSQNPRPDNDDEPYYRDEQRLDRSIQHVCQCEVLFQGREWQCRRCFNRNWLGVDALGRTMTCEVCGRTDPAPVSGEWHFRINPFVLEAYAEHGTEAAVWALWLLSQRAQYSFYFAPSLKLWLTPPSTVDQPCDAEIDAVAVVDGLTYVVEATTSKGLDSDEIERLSIVTDRIRPDVMLPSQCASRALSGKKTTTI